MTFIVEGHLLYIASFQKLPESQLLGGKPVLQALLRSWTTDYLQQMHSVVRGGLELWITVVSWGPQTTRPPENGSFWRSIKVLYRDCIES